MNKFTSVDDAVSAVTDSCTVAITGSGGGLLEPDALMAAIEQRFLTTGAPRDLTLIHAQGIGDGDRRGLNRLAYEGLVKRVIGAHWFMVASHASAGWLLRTESRHTPCPAA